MSYKDYFDFTKKERIGIITLFIIIAILLIAKHIVRNYEPEVDQTAYLKEIEKYQAAMKQLSEQQTNADDDEFNAKYDSLNLFEFNPNTADSSELIQLGFVPYQIKQLNNYRNKGGKFYKPEDLKKLYSVNDLQYNKLQEYIKIENHSYKKTDKPTMNALTLSAFNPNTVTAKELQIMGLNEKIIRNLIKYRNAGAHFYNKESLKKVFGITDKLYTDLAPYIVIEPTPKIEKKQAPPPIININTASATDLIKLNGIGTKLSERIVNFRNSLGGFYSKNQLKEVYGLSQETFSNIEQQLTVDSKNIHKININFATLNELKKHPYLDYQEAKKLVNYRSMKGSYETITILKEVINTTTYEKVKHYLCL